MAPKKREEAEVPAEAVAEEAPVKARGVKSANRAEVYTSKGQYVRTYTLEEHGPRFGKLAEGYAEKIKGSVR